MNLIFKRPNVLTLPLLLVLSLGLVTDSNAQIRGNEEEEEPILIEQEDLDELRLWIERDQKYEKVLFKAIRFIEDDEQKKHPVPYLFMSMAYFGIHNSDDAELRETYQVEKMKALKNACKYASKFVKKDKENDFVPQDQDYLDELRRETMDAANAEWDIEKYSKAKSYYKYLSDIDTEDPGGQNDVRHVRLTHGRPTPSRRNLGRNDQSVGESAGPRIDFKSTIAPARGI